MYFKLVRHSHLKTYAIMIKEILEHHIEMLPHD